MATNSPGQSIHLKSPRSPRQLPQLPQIPIGGQRSPTQLSAVKSPSTPLVFEFPPEYYPETPNTNFDFEQFTRVNETDRAPRSPSYYIRQGCRSPKSPNPDLLHSPGRKSPIFQFCETRKNLGKTMSYPPRSPIPGSPIIPARSPSSTSFGPKSPKPFDHRRNSCFGFTGSKSPMSPTIVTSSSHGPCSPKHGEIHIEISWQQRERDRCSSTGLKIYWNHSWIFDDSFLQWNIVWARIAFFFFWESTSFAETINQFSTVVPSSSTSLPNTALSFTFTRPRKLRK